MRLLHLAGRMWPSMLVVGRRCMRQEHAYVRMQPQDEAACRLPCWKKIVTSLRVECMSSGTFLGVDSVRKKDHALRCPIHITRYDLDHFVNLKMGSSSALRSGQVLRRTFGVVEALSRSPNGGYVLTFSYNS